MPADCHEIHGAAILHQAGFIKRLEMFMRIPARQNCTNFSTQTVLSKDQLRETCSGDAELSGFGRFMRILARQIPAPKLTRKMYWRRISWVMGETPMPRQVALRELCRSQKGRHQHRSSNATGKRSRGSAGGSFSTMEIHASVTVPRGVKEQA
jgi:hypothetical protein